jgi:hypothetical protein
LGFFWNPSWKREAKPLLKEESLAENGKFGSGKDFLEHRKPCGCQSPKELIKVVKHFRWLCVFGREDGWSSKEYQTRNYGW